MTMHTHVTRLSLVAMVCGACAVGPSPSVTPQTTPIVARTDGPMPPATRQFLDSLGTARQADRPDSAPVGLWKPRPLVAQSTRDLAWLDVLRDSQLVALVNTAVANNRDLQVAEARVREYRAERGVALGDFFPQISAAGAVSNNKVFFPGSAPIPYNAVTATGNLSWELDFWGRIRRETQAANFDLRAREEDARATTITLVSDVATAYLELRELDADLTIAEQTLASRQTTLDLARQRYQQGVISELDVRQFEADVADPAVRVADFARQRSAKEHQLAVLLGEPPSTIPRGRPLGDIVQAVTVPDSLPGTLIAQRPDVLSAQHAFQAATARIGVAIADRLPTVSITGSYGTERPNFTGLFTPQGEIYTVQAGISIPLFTGGKLSNAQRAAQARADEAKGQYEQTVLSALQESSDALASIRLTRDQLVAQTTQAQALQTAFSLAQRRYASGISSYLEVLDAQRSLFTAQLTLVQTERQYLSATVELYKALGGGWR
ncbi:MAG TPA: efflux transporter outer membrane subunit [Gemmatimonadaceae bacterium]|jgi:multidrug efflux system outer membrane protein|nr:efflux transporter outer membrane subunit [Gemmatimonadaceae bacterium]